MALGSRIRECRKKQKLSQEKVAELVGVSRQAVTKWEADLTMPNTENLFRLAEIFDTTVDYLAASEKSTSCSEAEQIYQLYKIDLERQKQDRKAKIIQNLKLTGSIVCGFLVYYLLCKLLWSSKKDMTFLGWLFGADVHHHDYLFGWILSKHLYLYCSLITIIPALFGKYRFSYTLLGGFVIGIPLGEYLGLHPEGAPYGYGHYGWAIWAGIYLISIFMGIWLQRFKPQELSVKSRKFHLWSGIFLAAVIALIIFVRLNMLDPSTIR